MRLSLFTPTHAPAHLLETYNSFCSSGVWHEWVVVPNSGCRVEHIPEVIRQDPRVSVIQAPEHLDAVGKKYNIGALKGFACACCTGDVFVEVDHDDLLVDPILKEVWDAFAANSDLALVYSNFANVTGDEWAPSEFEAYWGWQYRDAEYNGRKVRETIAPPPTAHTVSSMYWGPNHIRAFRRTAYEAVGGYNADLPVGDDQDLCCKLYCLGPFKHIDRLGYIYRIHGQNTWLQCTEEIQGYIKRTREYYLRQMITAEVGRANGVKIDLGGRFGDTTGYTTVDCIAAPGVDVVANLVHRYPFEDSSVDVVRANDFLEHVADKQHSLREIHRILKPGGYLISETPSTCGPNGEAGQGADQDPTHVSRWNRNSFWYVTRREQARFIDNTTVRFYPMVLENYWPSEWHKANHIPYVRADLICMKDGVQPSHGGIDI